MKFVEVLGFKLFSDNLSKIPVEGVDKCVIISTMSPNSYGITTYDSIFRDALVQCDYLLLDGVYFALSSLFLEGKNIKKNQGPDAFYHFMKVVGNSSGKAFFLGSTESTLQKIKKRAESEYPGIIVDYFSPPYKEVFDEIENNEMINKINKFKPDILFIGMTCPKQEKWANQHKQVLNAKLALCIGGVFDWYAGNYPEISPIWWKLRIGWIKRIIDRPEVLKRNLPNVLIFLRDVLLYKIGIKNYKKCKER